MNTNKKNKRTAGKKTITAFMLPVILSFLVAPGAQASEICESETYFEINHNNETQNYSLRCIMNKALQRADDKIWKHLEFTDFNEGRYALSDVHAYALDDLREHLHLYPIKHGLNPVGEKTNVFNNSFNARDFRNISDKIESVTNIVKFVEADEFMGKPKGFELSIGLDYGPKIFDEDAMFINLDINNMGDCICKK